jgi:peroxiredoxin family protein
MSIQTAPAVIPNFDDDSESGRKMAIICSKGNLDMAYPGLILANAALGEGVEVHLFFTFWGFDMILKSRMKDLKFSPVGNTAMHLPVGDARVPAALAPIPGMQAMATKMMKQQIHDLGVPDVPDANRCRGWSFVGLPDERRHDARRRVRSVRRGRGDHQRESVHRDDQRGATALHLADGWRRSRTRPTP